MPYELRALEAALLLVTQILGQEVVALESTTHPGGQASAGRVGRRVPASRAGRAAGSLDSRREHIRMPPPRCRRSRCPRSAGAHPAQRGAARPRARAPLPLLRAAVCRIAAAAAAAPHCTRACPPVRACVPVRPLPTWPACIPTIPTVDSCTRSKTSWTRRSRAWARSRRAAWARAASCSSCHGHAPSSAPPAATRSHAPCRPLCANCCACPPPPMCPLAGDTGGVVGRRLADGGHVPVQVRL